MEKAYYCIFLYILPLLLILSLIILLLFSGDKLNKFLEKLHLNDRIWILMNNLTFILTVISISIAIGMYFLSEHRQYIKSVQIQQTILENFHIEIAKNRQYCSNFLKDKDNYIKTRQFPLWALRTAAMQQVMGENIFNGENFRLLFELHNIIAQYNVLIEIMRNPSTFPDPQWDKFNKSNIENLTEKTNMVLQAYDEIENAIKKLPNKHYGRNQN